MKDKSLSPIFISLVSIPLFKVLDERTIRWLAAQIRQKRYSPEEIVFFEGEPSSGLYWLQAGWLKAVKQAVNGREQILQFFEAGNTFHEIGGFTDMPNPATAIALDDALVWLIPKEAMMQLLREHPEFARHVIATLAARIQTLVALVEDLSLRPVIGRLSRLIVDDAVDGVLQRPRWYTQVELASRLGTVPDVVQRTLRGLEADGLIKVDRRQIIILDRERLVSLAE